MIYSERRIGVRFPEIADISILDQVLGSPNILSVGTGVVSVDGDLRSVNLTDQLQLVLGLKNTRRSFYNAAYNSIVFASLIEHRK
jgi:hypothetical protein